MRNMVSFELDRAHMQDHLSFASAASVWPGNGGYRTRLAYVALKTHFSSGHTSEKAVVVISLQELLSSLTEEESGALEMAEEDEPRAQTLDIPFAWKGRAYRFFFGNLERPLAFYQKFVEDFLPFDNLFFENLGYRVSAAFHFALAHQDLLIEHLLPFLENAGQPQNRESGIYVPSTRFLHEWGEIQKASVGDTIGRLDHGLRHEAELWIERSLEQQPPSFRSHETLEHYEEMGRYLFVRRGDAITVPFPWLYLEALFLHFREALLSFAAEETSIERCHWGSSCQRIYESSVLLASKSRDAQVFPSARIVRGRAMSDEIPVVVLFDTDKLLLLDSAEAVECERLERRASATVTRLRSAMEVASLKSAAIRTVNGTLVPLSQKPEVFPLVTANVPTLEICVAQGATLPETAEVMSLQDWQAIAQHLDGFMELIAFLRDLQEIRRTAGIIYTDFLDVVGWFSDTHGSMLHSLAPVNLVVVQPHWWSNEEVRRIAARSRERRILAKVDHPEHVISSWLSENILRTFEPLSRKGLMLLELGSRIIVVHVCSSETAESDVGLNAALADGLCRALEQASTTVTRSLDKAGLPDIVHIWLYGEDSVCLSPSLGDLKRRLDERPNQDMVTLSRLVHSPRDAVFVAVIYRRRFLLLFEDPQNVGERELLRQVFQGLLGAVGIPAPTTERLLEKALPQGEKTISIDSVPTGHAWVRSIEPRLPSKTFEIAVYSHLAGALRSQGIRPGIYEGQEAWRLLRRTLYEQLLLRLDDLLCSVRQGSAVQHAYQLVEQSYAYYFVERQRLGISYRSIALEFDPGSRLSEAEEKAMRVAQIGAMILERSLIVSTSGGSFLTHEAWETIFATASEALVLVQGSLMHYHRLESLRVILGEGAELGVEGAGERVVDLKAWREAASTEMLGERESGSEPQHSAGDHVGGDDALPGLQDISGPFAIQFGYRLDDLIVVLMALAHYPVDEQDPGFPLVLASLANVTEQIKKLIIHPPSARIVRAVLRDLTLDPTGLASTTWNPWELRSREHRLTMQPLVPVGRKLLFGPWTAEHAAKSWLSYLYEGRLPLPERTLSNGLRRALEKFRSARNRDLERDVKRIADDNRLRCKINVKKLKKLFGVEPARGTGEIDALVAEPQTRVLHVLEVKDPTRPLTVGDIASDLEDFFGGHKSYQAKLERKVEYVQKAKKQVLAWLGVRGMRGWRVQGAFVTRHSSPAGFSRFARYPFVVIDRLPEYLRKKRGR